MLENYGASACDGNHFKQMNTPSIRTIQFTVYEKTQASAMNPTPALVGGERTRWWPAAHARPRVPSLLPAAARGSFRDARDMRVAALPPLRRACASLSRNWMISFGHGDEVPSADDRGARGQGAVSALPSPG